MALSLPRPLLRLSDRDIRPISPPESTADVSMSERELDYGSRGLDPALLGLASGQVVAILTPLMDLPDDWDSYGGRPLTHTGAEYAEKLVAPLLVQGVSPPAFVPTSDGGLSLEWHRPSMQLVIQIPSRPESDPPTAFFAEGSDEWERPLAGALPEVRMVLSRFVGQTGS